MSMFCYQCEQTGQMTGCTAFGVCGKDPETAALQDLLVHAAKGIAQYAYLAAKNGKRNAELNAFILDALFTTVTNVNFDPQRMEQELIRAEAFLHTAKGMAEATVGIDKTNSLTGPCTWVPATGLNQLIAQGEQVSIDFRNDRLGVDVTGLQELLTYGLKGAASYAHHARSLGHEDNAVYDFLLEALAFLAEEPTDIDALLAMNLRCGEITVTVLALLDAANTSSYGHPVPTPVNTGHKQGKAILVSGHDLLVLANLLKQTEGKGIHIYTHGEMLPAHGYPELNKYPHFAGHYGSAWQNQRDEFETFPGAILMTTNCIQKPKETYKARIFTCGLVAWPNVEHIAGEDYSSVIQAALDAPGFETDAQGRTLTVGFAHNTVLSLADKVIEAIKAKQIRHFFLIGGCDGAKPGRNYFSDLAKAVPDDCIVLTCGCGKFRVNQHEYGDIGGIPRLLDCGQCNDSYSAVKIAMALADAFQCGINDLPLSLVISWYEQKAVCILLALLHLGVRDIRLGPNLPAFVSENVLKVLVNRFNLMPVKTVEQDLADCLKA